MCLFILTKLFDTLRSYFILYDLMFRFDLEVYVK